MPDHTIFNERPESQDRALKVIEKLGYTIVPRSEAEKKTWLSSGCAVYGRTAVFSEPPDISVWHGRQILFRRLHCQGDADCRPVQCCRTVC